MDASNSRRSSTINRRISLRSPNRQSQQHDDADDGYDLDAMGISDGFRPSDASNTVNRPSRSSYEQIPRRSTPPPRPSSTTKPRYTSFALQHDGSTNMSAPLGPAALASASTAGLLSRTSSASTITPFVRPESPYQGPSAPSHPYQMYPQDAARIARSASVATTSTYQAPPSITYTGPGAPTHPYALYPQNTVSETEEGSPSSVIPVGFPGRNAEYQRRLGPEGEEAADLIGPDGHTEQLPPYTRYAEDAFARKTAVAEAASRPVVVTSGPAMAAPGPSTEALINPFDSPVERIGSSGTESNPNGAMVEEKPAEKRWKTIAKRKVWGIVPIWVFVLIGAVILLFAVVVGVAIGVVRARMHPPPPPMPSSTTGNEYVTTVTTTYDATQLATAPANLPALQTGTYWLDISSPQSSSSNCIDDSSLLGAWSCSIPMNMLEVTVNYTGSYNNLTNYDIGVMENSATNSGPPQYFYGSQPPIITGQNTEMTLVNDTNAARYGPAWFYQTFYDKLVIVPATALTPPSKRGLSERVHFGMLDFTPVRRGVAQPSETPWFCYWNHTMLETFIYPNASSSNVATTTTSAAASTATATGVVLQQFSPPYPKIIRVEERRLPRIQSRPYCQKMLILDDGWAAPYIDPTTNQIVTFQLNETESTYMSSSGSKRSVRLFGRDSSDDSSCNCVWLAS